ncbi:MAG: phosphate ABC transporter permease subunit PstC [Caldilineaceae bacterium]|nr:phosphate ABC transporter permease subunit PstC [Caldilineaceae bacterium]MDE0631826.1 phosphate ABC transporter permease subunit PstC [Caldilineaceae bacterium]
MTRSAPIAQAAISAESMRGPVAGAESKGESVLGGGPPLDLSRKPRVTESLIQGFLFLCGAISILTTLGIVYVLGRESLLFFANEEVNLFRFFGGTEWQPAIGRFGIWPLVTATFMASLMAMAVALPVGLCIAIYLSEYAPQRTRSILKPILEVLAGIPTVVYGYFALTFMTPLLRGVFGRDIVEIYNTASAGIVIGILVIPLVSSMSEDALSAVPNALRQASYGLGATRLETAVRIVLPAALSGVAAAFIVAISRAVGETMIVAIAAGAGPNFTFSPFRAAETMTGHIVRISGGDLSYDSIDYNSIFAIGMLLFLLTLSLNVLSQWIVRRFREEYE